MSLPEINTDSPDFMAQAKDIIIDAENDRKNTEDSKSYAIGVLAAIKSGLRTYGFPIIEDTVRLNSGGAELVTILHGSRHLITVQTVKS